MTERDANDAGGRRSAEAMRAAADPYSLHEPEQSTLAVSGSRRQATRSETVRIGLRTVVAVIGIVVAVTVVVGATLVSGPRVTTRSLGTIVAPAPTSQQRVCPGPLQKVQDDADQTLTSVGEATENYRASAGTIFTDRLGQSTSVPSAPPNAGPLRLTLPPRGSTSALLSGSQSQSLVEKDLSGLAVAECAVASGDVWIVGGSTDIGRSSLLLVSNPSLVSATITIDIFGEAGKISAPGMAGLIVAPGTTHGFSLAGFAPGLVSPAVHVTSRGGQIVATLQQSIVRTLQPSGVDLVGVSQAPSRTATIPALVLANTAAVTAAQGAGGYGDLEATVRLLAPGEIDATAVVTIVAAGGSGVSPVAGAAATASNDDAAASGGTASAAPPTSAGVSFPVSLVAGRVTDVGLPGLEDGNYVVAVSSSQPVVAAARSSVVGANAASDFCWLASAGTLGERQQISVAPGPSPILNLANPGTRSREVTVAGIAGSRKITVPAGGGTGTPLTPGENVVLTGARGLVASVSYRGDALLAGFTVTPPDTGSGPITVYR